MQASNCSKAEPFALQVLGDSMQPEFMDGVVIPVAESVARALEPVLSVIGNSSTDAQSLLNQRLDVISDILDEDVTLKSLLDNIGIEIESFLNSVTAAANAGANISTFIREELVNDEMLEFGKFTFGGLEFVLDPKSPFYFPKTKTPVPTYFTDIANGISELDPSAIFRFQPAVNIMQAGGFTLDIFSPRSIIDLITGQPFNIISFGIPTISANPTLEFQVPITGNLVKGAVRFNSNFRIAYDSLGIERIIESMRANTEPDWLDLLDGLAIQNDPTGYELGAGVEFTVTVPEPQPNSDPLLHVGANLGFELLDPNNDGKLRLGEIFEITNDFRSPERLFCMFDIQANANLQVGEWELDTGELSLQELISNTFSICDDEATDPILAEVEVIGGENVLFLNTGPRAHRRRHGDTSDDSNPGANIRVRQAGSQVSVSGFATTQTFANIDRIIGIGGNFNDIFDLSGVTSIPVELDGRGGSDRLMTGNGPDFIKGGSGNDTIYAGAGHDIIDVGNGRNTVFDGLGNDRIDFSRNNEGRQEGDGVVFTTQGGDDTVIGSRYNDTITALAGDFGDVVFEGGPGDDNLIGANGNDILDGGRGMDTIVGNGGRDQLIGGRGDDRLDGRYGDHSDVDMRIEGGFDDDTLIVGLGDRFASGDSGKDDLIISPEKAVTATLTDRQFKPTGEPSGTYEKVESIEVRLDNDGADEFIVDGPTLLQSVLGGDANDQVRIKNLPSPLMVASVDNLIIDRTAKLDPGVGFLSSEAITGLGPADVDYTNVQNLTIEFGNADDQLTILSTNRNTETTINGGAGADHVSVQSVDGVTAINGNRTGTNANNDAEDDKVVVVVPGNAADLSVETFRNLSFAVDLLEIDNSDSSSPAEWAFRNDRIVVNGNQILDSVGVETISIRGGSALSDSLAVEDEVDALQVVSIDGSRVQIDEGATVLNPTQHSVVELEGFTFSESINSLDGVSDIVVSPDGQHVYTTAANSNAVTVFLVNSDGELEFVQVLKDGTFGVEGLRGAGDIVVSPDGNQVYVVSTADNAIAIFERVALSGRLSFRGIQTISSPKGLAISPNGRNLYVSNSNTMLTRFTRDNVTGQLTMRESSNAAQGELKSIAVGLENENVFAIGTSALSHFYVGSTGRLPQSPTSANQDAYTNLAVADNRTVHATYDGGVATFSYTNAGLSAATRNLVVDAPNLTTATAIAVSQNQDRAIVGVDTTSTNPTPPATEFVIAKLIVTDEWELTDSVGDIFIDNVLIPKDEIIFFDQKGRLIFRCCQQLRWLMWRWQSTTRKPSKRSMKNHSTNLSGAWTTTIRHISC